MAGKYVSDFFTKLQSKVKGSHTVTRWTGTPTQRLNLLQFGEGNEAKVLYVKESHNERGFWGLTKNQIIRIEKSKIQWFAVFLHRSAAAGYLIGGSEIRRGIDSREITLSEDGDYKFHEYGELFTHKRFRDIDELINRIRF